jgi:uncharacterized membrane protein
MRPWEIHPVLVHFPLGLLLTAVALDLYAAIRRRTDLTVATTWLMIGGVTAGLLATAAGVLAFATVPAHTTRAHTMMYWHLGFAATALIVLGLVAYARWRHPAVSRAARGGGVLGALLLGVAGYLGGSLVFRGGAGVDPALLAPEVRAMHSHDDSQEQDGHHHH